MSDSRTNLPLIGSRFVFQDHRGTICYTGPVDGTTGVWLGVEWDDTGRGKHSGERGGKSYFTSRTPGSCSFIRPTSTIQYGMPFLDALVGKYVEQVRGGEMNEFVTLGSSQGAIQVEAVNMDKVRSKFAQLGKLREISLDGEHVAECGPSPDNIRSTCCSARGLDLSRTLLSSWGEISLLCVQMVQLERLFLNQNRFYSFTLTLTENVPPFVNLKELRLNATLMTWSETQDVVCWMPRLKILEVGHNRIHSVPPSCSRSARPQPNLEVLNLDNNAIEDLPATVGALETFYPSLRRLVLGTNVISAIEPPKVFTEERPLRNLTHLVVSSNTLGRWDDINALAAHFPRLESLNIMGNPIGDQPYARQIMIAILPSLLRLDSTDISLQERKDSEILYLSFVTRGVDLSPSAAHVQRLSTVHDFSLQVPSNSTSQKPSEGKLVNQLIAIELIHRSSNDLMSEDKHINQSIRVLPTMTLRVFRKKVKKVIGVSPKSDLNLFVVMPDQILAPLEEDTQDLAWWGIEDGSRIVFVSE